MTMSDLIEFLDFGREKTLATLEAIAKMPDAAKALGWRPGAGRAHTAWQLMHIGATDDRHVHVRMKGGQPQHEEYVKRFAGGSVPDDNVPSVDEIKRYLVQQREELLAHLKTVPAADLDKKPNDQAPWTYRQWMKVLAWHEAHHQGQAHITLNMYKAGSGG